MSKHYPERGRVVHFMCHVSDGPSGSTCGVGIDTPDVPQCCSDGSRYLYWTGEGWAIVGGIEGVKACPFCGSSLLPSPTRRHP